MNKLEITVISPDSRQARELISEQNLRSKKPSRNHSMMDNVEIDRE